MSTEQNAAAPEAGPAAAQPATAHAAAAANRPAPFGGPQRRDCDLPGKALWLMQNTSFVIDQRYVPIRLLGRGAHSTTCAAKDLRTGDKVAIQKIQRAFENDFDARSVLREVLLQRALVHDNVLGIPRLMLPASRDYEDVYTVQELMDTDLHRVIYSSQPLSNEHCQYFVFQVRGGAACTACNHCTPRQHMGR